MGGRQTASHVAPQSIDPMPLTPGEFDALIRKETGANTMPAQAAGLTFN
jgi:hypothetical protein